jgi:hypothetical protein
VTEITPATPASEVGFLDQLRAAGKLRQASEVDQFTVVGYGSIPHWPPGPPPQIDPIDGKRRIARSDYQNLRKAWLHLMQNESPGKESEGACYGDSGGPAFWVEDDSKILVAVTSWGDARCVANANYYRVDIPESLSFIDDLISTIENPPSAPAAKQVTTCWGQIKKWNN